MPKRTLEQRAKELTDKIAKKNAIETAKKNLQVSKDALKKLRKQ